ncbi:zinc finger protein 394 isoform X1 [Salmo salar]|uniref:Zinc finger protein 394 isoform X1 n=1 Tax=Salmo salar TaxID=8030 RepID=A0A1S3NI74_SALSA|nr:zinc finger protein 394 isoform X1 [Salmo salar]|eukprot:XP_014014886.1 PREDICTED: zinc finger protein 394-like isoform X1 [Salmo salar]
MEIHRCIVRGCANKSDAIIHYSLPEEPQRRQLWLQFINASNSGENIPGVSRLCGDHFTEDCFTKLDLGFTTRLILNLDAVPTIYSTNKTSAYRQHTVSAESGKGTGMLEVKKTGIKEEPVDREVDSQVNRSNNLLGTIKKSFSSIKEENVGEDASIAGTYDQIRVVKIGDSHTGERKKEGGEYGMEYSHSHQDEGEEGGYDAMVTEIHREERMKGKGRMKEWMMEKINVTEHEVEVFVIENSNPEEEWREYVLGEEEEGWRIEERGEGRMEEMWVKKGRRKKLPGPQWWRWEQERKKTEEDEWKMIAERAREEERERQKGQTVEEEEKKRKKKRVAGFRCPQCSNHFQSRSELMEHKTGCCNDAKYTCPVPLCPKHYTTNRSLRTHIRFHCVKDDKKKKKALETIQKAQGAQEQKMKAYDAYLKAQKAHEVREQQKKAYDAYLTAQVQQNQYQPSHKKKFFCPLCNIYYRNQTNLDKHSRCHTSVHKLTFRCSFCSLEILRKYTTKKHYDLEHPGRVPHCEECGKTFNSIDSFLKHQVRHLSVTPYYCYECRIYQLTQRGLTAHLRNHSLRRNQEQLAQQSGKLYKPDKTMSHSTAPLHNNPASLQYNHAHLQDIKEELITIEIDSQSVL